MRLVSISGPRFHVVSPNRSVSELYIPHSRVCPIRVLGGPSSVEGKVAILLQVHLVF